MGKLFPIMLSCARHPEATAGWKCDACGELLCPACTASQHRGGARFDHCSLCGGFARQLTVSRSERDPFDAAQLIRALRWPFNGPGLLVAFACAMVLSAFGLIGATTIGRAAVVAFLFQIVRHTALGKDDVPGPEDFRGYVEDIVAPSLRLTVALAWIWLPALAWNHWHQPPADDGVAQQESAVDKALRPGGQGVVMRGGRVVRAPGGLEVIERDAPIPAMSPQQIEEQKALEARQHEGQDGEDEASAQPGAPQDAQAARTDPAPEASKPRKTAYLVPALLVILGILIAPMSLLVSALQTPLSIAANPLLLIGYAFRLGRDYARVVLFCCLAVGASFAVRGLEKALGAVPLHGLLGNLAQILVALIAFRAIGLLVRARGDDLGYGGVEHYQVAALPDAVPLLDFNQKPDAPVILFDHAGNPISQDKPPLPRAQESIELDESPPAPAASGAEPQPLAPAYRPPGELELELEPEDAVKPGEDPNDAMTRLLALGDHAGCLAMLESHGAKLRPQLLSAQSWLALGKKAHEARAGKAAAFALKRCIEQAPEGPLAPGAWLLAARIYDQLLGDRATSDRLLRELVKRFPASHEGEFAARRTAQAATAKS